MGYWKIILKSGKIIKDVRLHFLGDASIKDSGFMYFHKYLNLKKKKEKKLLLCVNCDSIERVEFMELEDNQLCSRLSV